MHPSGRLRKLDGAASEHAAKRRSLLALPPHSTTAACVRGEPDKRRRASEVMSRFIKVKSHSGESLNETADALAGAAAEMDPTRPVDVDPEGVYFYYH